LPGVNSATNAGGAGGIGGAAPTATTNNAPRTPTNNQTSAASPGPGQVQMLCLSTAGSETQPFFTGTDLGCAP
jgi:hypothetical protein